jgi:hypothetical protein
MAHPIRRPGMTQRERDAAAKRAFRQDPANVEKIRRYKAEYYRTHREQVLAYMRSRSKSKWQRQLERRGVAVDPISVAMRAWK